MTDRKRTLQELTKEVQKLTAEQASLNGELKQLNGQLTAAGIKNSSEIDEWLTGKKKDLEEATKEFDTIVEKIESALDEFEEEDAA